MKIVLMEPLGVSSEIIEKLADGLVSAGHTFASYDTFIHYGHRRTDPPGR